MQKIIDFLKVPFIRNEHYTKIGWNLLLFLIAYTIGVILTLIITGNFQPTDGSRPSVNVTLTAMGIGIIVNHMWRVLANKYFENSSYGYISSIISVILVIISFFVIRQF